MFVVYRSRTRKGMCASIAFDMVIMSAFSSQSLGAEKVKLEEPEGRQGEGAQLFLTLTPLHPMGSKSKVRGLSFRSCRDL